MPSSLKIISSKMKHKKLSENWMEAKPVVIEGMKFTSKYIGMTLVDSPKGEEMAAAAIKRIFTASKASGKEPPLVLLTVSPKGIHVKDLQTEEIMHDVDISRISFCTVDKTFGKVFGFVAQNPSTEAFECHGYMCNSRKEAQSLTLTLAQAFTIAYEFRNKDDNETKSIGISEDSSDVVSTDNKKLTNLYRSILDSKYKRLSNSSADVHQTDKPSADDMKENSGRSGDDDTDSFDFSHDFTELPCMSQTQPIKSFESDKAESSGKNSQAVISIMPPPSTKGKPSRRIPSYSHGLVDVTLIDQGNKKSVEESENLEFDFAELALSRTKES